MILDGMSVVAVPANTHSNLASDLTIFAVVRQDPNNDGYLVGKGINDKMRDFGLYLRSSKRTIWLAYGSDANGQGFREILFFYDVSVADGNFHSVAAVIESSVSTATLYIDGVTVGTRTLPSVPQFRPGVSEFESLQDKLDVRGVTWFTDHGVVCRMLNVSSIKHVLITFMESLFI